MLTGKINITKHFLRCIILAALVLSVTHSCTVLPKGGKSYFGEERVFSKAFINYPVKYRQTEGREPGWELGISFIPHKNGRITGVNIKNPTVGLLPVTLWDAETKQVVWQTQATVDGSNSYNKIYLAQPVYIMANKKYCITINTTKYFYHELPYTPLPFEASNITLTGCVYEEAYNPRYPQFEIRDVLHGLIDLNVEFELN